MKSQRLNPIFKNQKIFYSLGIILLTLSLSACLGGGGGGSSSGYTDTTNDDPYQNTNSGTNTGGTTTGGDNNTGSGTTSGGTTGKLDPNSGTSTGGDSGGDSGTTGGSTGGGTTTPTYGAFRMTSVSPSDGATGIAVNTTFRVTFTNPIQASSISAVGLDTDNVKLFPRGQPGNLVSVAVSVSSTASNTLIIRPRVDLAASTPYTLNILTGTTGLRDIYNQQLSSLVMTEATTAAAAGTNPYLLTFRFNMNAGSVVTSILAYWGRTSRSSSGFSGYEQTNFNVNTSPSLPSSTPLSTNTSFTTQDIRAGYFLSNTYYYLTLRACNNNGCSPYSNELRFSVP